MVKIILAGHLARRVLKIHNNNNNRVVKQYEWIKTGGSIDPKNLELHNFMNETQLLFAAPTQTHTATMSSLLIYISLFFFFIFFYMTGIDLYESQVNFEVESSKNIRIAIYIQNSFP